MTDIAPLGFAIDTTGLDRGKRSADEFAKSALAGATATDKLTQANIAAAKAASDAAAAAARTAAAKLNLARVTEGVSAATIKEAQATKQSADAAAIAARAKYDLAKAGEHVEDSMEGVTGKSRVLAGVLQGVSREAAAMATTMGMGTGGRLGMGAAMGAAQGAAGRLGPQLLALGGVAGKLTLGVGALAAGYVTLSATLADNQDRWASYQQQLVNSLGSQSAATSGLFQVVDLANQVGISVDAALQSFNRFARAKDAIGATNEELVQMTEIILKIGRSSGVDQGSMQGAMMQLSQALASGRLNGDELRSIMENMQPLAKAIADGLGVSVGQLRRMGAEGELTGDKIFKALISQGAKANEAFASMPTTVEQAKTRMANQFDELGAHLGKLINASGLLQGGFNALSAPVEGLNQMFRAVANDGMASVETNLKKMEARVAKLKQQTAPAAQEFDKQFNKEAVKADDLTKQRRDAEARLAQQREELAAREQLLVAQAMRVNNSREDILRLIAMGKTRLGFTQGAKEKIEDLGVGAFQAGQKGVEDASKAVDRSVKGLEELRRQEEALGRSDAFEKIIGQAEDLEKAFAKGGDTMSDMWLQAIDIARQTGRSIDDVVVALQRLNAAQRQIADAKEIRGLRTEMEKLAAVTAAIGGGSYAQRVAQHQADISSFREERAASGGGSFSISAAPGSASLPADIVSFFMGRGKTAEQSRGIAAGIMSESSGNERAVNPSSGAYGLGQWLGARKAGLMNRFGANPSRVQQLSYLDSEIMGGDAGGASVLQGTSAADVAARYIRDFMRPGKDTAGGIQRALAALGGGTVSGGTGVDTGAEQIVSGRNAVFGGQEAQRAAQLMSGLRQQKTDSVSMGMAIQQGPEAVRALELELKVLAAIDDVAPEYRQMVADAIEDADASERKAKAEQQIYDMRRANEDQSRRNDAARTGDPRAMRQLELELRIEEIKRTAPASQQGRLITAARTADGLTGDATLAKREGDMRNQQRVLKEQFRLVGLIGDEERVKARLLAEENALYESGVDLTSQQAEQYLALVELLERQNIALEKQLELWHTIKETGAQVAEDIGRAFSTSFGSAIRTGKTHWRDFIGAIEEAFYSAVDNMVEKLVISPLMNVLQGALTSGLNSLFGGISGGGGGGGGGTPTFTPTNPGVGFANGAVFPFAGGSMFNTPTRFGRNGNGLAGEGPGLYEGLFPLKRGPDGRLGIAAHGAGGGGSSSVNIYDMRGAGSSEAVEVQERQTGDGMNQIDVMIRDSVKGHMRKGSFDSDQRSIYGLPRAVTRR